MSGKRKMKDPSDQTNKREKKKASSRPLRDLPTDLMMHILRLMGQPSSIRLANTERFWAEDTDSPLHCLAKEEVREYKIDLPSAHAHACDTDSNVRSHTALEGWRDWLFRWHEWCATLKECANRTSFVEMKHMYETYKPGKPPPHVRAFVASQRPQDNASNLNLLHLYAQRNDPELVELLLPFISPDAFGDAPISPKMAAMFNRCEESLRLMSPENIIVPLTCRVLLLDMNIPESLGDEPGYDYPVSLVLTTPVAVLKRMIIHYHSAYRGAGGITGACVLVFFDGEELSDNRSLAELFPDGQIRPGHTLLIHLTGYDFDVDEEIQDLTSLVNRGIDVTV